MEITRNSIETGRGPEDWFTGMPDRVAKHLSGGPGTPAFDDWAWHPALRILYVNTFKRVI